MEKELPLKTSKEQRLVSFSNMAWIPGGTFLMGSDRHYPEETPVHKVAVNEFWIDKYNVTNENFKKFTDDAGYLTVAERSLNPEDYPGTPIEMLIPGSLVFMKSKVSVDMRNITNWWKYVAGANWKHPEGPSSSLVGRWHHPAVHIAYEDAEAFANWAGKELPTEAEWEFAARGGLEAKEFAWGDEPSPNGTIMANTWEGEFPWQNLKLDGYEGTCPVKTFPANAYGLFEMTGNVWEWTADWFDSRHSADKNKACCIPVNPRGASKESSYDPQQRQVKIPRKVLKGGSHLCSLNYCYRFRPAARSAQMIDTASCHVGFRCVVRQEG